MKKLKKYSGWVVAFVFCVAVIAVYKTFDNISNITKYIGIILDAISPFVGAFVIAYILNMPAKRLNKLLAKTKNSFVQKHSLGLSILIVYIIALCVVFLALSVLIPAIYKNIMDLYNNAEMYLTNLQNYIMNLDVVKKTHLLDNGIDVQAVANKIFGDMDTAQISKYAAGVFSVTSGIFSVFVAIIASIYMLLDKERCQRAVVRAMCVFFKRTTVKTITEHAKRINDIFTNYIYSRLMCSIIMAIVCSIVLTLLNVKYGLILGIFIGAMDMIPYFGSIISCVIAIVVTLITGGMWKGIWVAIALIILQQIDGNLLGPKIMSNSLEIRPLWIIFAVSVGGTLFGFIGMLVSVPVLAIVRAIASDYLLLKEEKKRAAEDKAD
jgi:predicted PurR-regulated permease PerM